MVQPCAWRSCNRWLARATSSCEVSAVSRSICTMAASLLSALQGLNGLEGFAGALVGPLVQVQAHALHGKLGQEGSCDRTPFEPKERKKDQLWQLSAHCPRVFGHHEHLAALV